MRVSILKSLATLFFLAPFLAGAQSFTSTITLQSELTRIASPGSLPSFVTGTEAQISTYDTTGGNSDGFNGTYSFIRRRQDSSLVMLDLDGPGEINRIATPTPTTDTLDFYFDGETKPRLSIKYTDLFNGNIAPFLPPLCDTGAGGNFCYIPILFQRHLTIVSRGKNLQFHQLQYRLFPKSTTVATYSAAAVTQAVPVLKDLARHWKMSPGQRMAWMNPEPGLMDKTNLLLRSGDKGTLARIKRGGRIMGIQLNADKLLMQNASKVWLSVTYDDNTLPAIEAPVADLFGYVDGKPSMTGLLLGADTTMAYCYLPMPFERSAKVELIYKGTGPSLHCRSTIFYTATQALDPAKEGKLYVHYQADTLTANDPYHIFLNIPGKGHYVGTILYANGLGQPGTEFFEGDDSLATDGAMRIHGTGSEDYFNGGWYALPGRWDTARSFPLSGCLLYSEKRSETGGYRFYPGDKVPFTKRIWIGIEHGPDPSSRIPARYRSLAFYYKQ